MANVQIPASPRNYFVSAIKAILGAKYDLMLITRESDLRIFA